MNQTVSPETVRIDDRTYRIEDNGVRCFLFIGNKSALLVDTGFGQSGSLKAVVESLTDKPVTLVSTHADFDHIGGNAEFGPAHMHPAEMAHYFLTASPTAEVRALWGNMEIDIGGRRFEVVFIPGHTPGSIALIDRESRIAVTGDSVSASPVFMFGQMRSFHAYIESMKMLAELHKSGMFDTIYPSHGPFPIPAGQIEKMIAAAEKMLLGELSPMEPPFELPAKMYQHDGAAFFY